MSSSRESLTAARRAFDAGDYETVIATVDELSRAGHVPLAGLRLIRDAHWKMGELHRSLAVLNRIRRRAPSSALDDLARRDLGRIVETDPDWAPSLPPVPVPRSRPSTVLHVLKESLPYVETGFTMRSRMTLSAQQQAGMSPHVVTSLGFPATKGVPDAPEHETVDGIPHHRLLADADEVGAMPFDVQVEQATTRMASVALDVASALVQAGTGYRGFETALSGIAIADRHDVPFVYEVRGFQEQTWTGNADRSERGEYYRRRRRQEDRCMARAERVLTIGDAMAEEIARRGVDEERLGVVPNAVDVERFTPREKREDLVDRYGLTDRPVVGYVSNLGAREGIDQLLVAVDVLRRRIPEVACFVAGSGPERPRLDALVEELELSDHVVLAGHVPNEEIEDHYALIDLFVVPRIDDRAARLVTPLKPLEAMSMRLPVVVSALPALEELVEPGVRGMSVPPSDPYALADTMLSLLEDDTTRERFAQAGHEWVHQHRTVASNAARYADLLGPLL